jgi:hypothetical protein
MEVVGYVSTLWWTDEHAGDTRLRAEHNRGLIQAFRIGYEKADAPELYRAARGALDQMVRAASPDNTYTDAVDALDAALLEYNSRHGLPTNHSGTQRGDTEVDIRP